MKITLPILLCLACAFVFTANQVSAAEDKKLEAISETSGLTNPEIKPASDEVVPESKASVAQENSLKKSNTETVVVSDAKPKRESDLIEGLILNRAMTRIGHQFYREFVSAYRDIGGATKHSGITVIEQATARSGSKILIQQNRKTIFVTFVSPISRNLEQQVNYAAKRVNTAVIKQNEQAVLGALLDPDLAPDEF
ncbi:MULTISPECIES: curli production assembly/transport protein CsgE [Shewanella]|uniref:Curli production assembly/transport component CsgE n=1 Tax=Shewanella japonica TaxID=93973 RepID=A0ABN4YFV5_9GAMM|nr:curli production assembly/transport protein CsgE [Shewanella japonica]ARD22016.1 hypothetical protein SJ2017_1703 [Shewanella japonica]